MQLQKLLKPQLKRREGISSRVNLALGDLPLLFDMTPAVTSHVKKKTMRESKLVGSSIPRTERRSKSKANR